MITLKLGKCPKTVLKKNLDQAPCALDLIVVATCATAGYLR